MSLITATHQRRHIGYDLYEEWFEAGQFHIRQPGSREVLFFDNAEEMESHYIRLEVEFHAWIEAVFGDHRDDPPVSQNRLAGEVTS